MDLYGCLTFVVSQLGLRYLLRLYVICLNGCGMLPETEEAIDILRTPLLTSGTVELSC